MKLHGIHHITAIASDPQRNLDFYAGVLGLRLVKRTVNFDDPNTYHFYFGDRLGNPGTIITFFPWPTARRGRVGTGQVVATSYAIAPGATDYWTARCQEHGIDIVEKGKRFDQAFIRFQDPDGLVLELIESDSGETGDRWEKSPIPAKFSATRFHSPSLASESREATTRLLTTLFGFEIIGRESDRTRLTVSPGLTNAQIDLVDYPGNRPGRVLAGTVHHIAFRAKDQDEQEHWRSKLYQAGLHVTPIIDRQYFHSVYFREPGGILFEIATDGPGFATDETEEHLGENLRLPPQYESLRSEIERSLPSISLPQISG
jgi:catechol 2,3-dioxygenase-like lactoylglutathione lyase family enzyme